MESIGLVWFTICVSRESLTPSQPIDLIVSIQSGFVHVIYEMMASYSANLVKPTFVMITMSTTVYHTIFPKAGLPGMTQEKPV